MAKRKQPVVLDIDEMINDPSQRGMLSFFDVSPEQKRKMLEARSTVERNAPIPFPTRPETESSTVVVPVDSISFESVPVDSSLPAHGASSASIFGAPKIGAPNALQPTVRASLEVISQTNISAPEFGAPNFSAANFGALTIDAAEGESLPPTIAPGTSNEGAPNFGAANFSATEFSAPISSAPTFDVSELLVRRSGQKTYTIHPVHRIEDSLTPAERDLLKWLWEKGRPVPSNSRLRLATGSNGEGARRLAAQAGLIYNTFKNLTRSLAAKFALDIVKPEKNLPAVYVVHHFSAILERQRQAGFSGVLHKNGGGRELVTANAQPARARPDLAFSQLEQMLGALNVGALNYNTGAPKFTAGSGNFGAPKIEAPIRNKEYTSSQQDTTTATAPNFGAPKIVLEALFDRSGRSDGEAARMILKGCLEVNSSIQPAEVARLIRTFHIPANIANPVGLLIRTLPNHCAPESIGNYREQWRKADEQERMRREHERHETLETARGVLEGVAKGEKWDADTVEWAQSVVEQAGK